MPRSVVYSEPESLLFGDIPIGSGLNTATFIEDAADEIDAALGWTYQTPFDITPSGAMAEPAKILIKRISNYLASGRAILAVDAGGEDTALHAYGLRLVNEGLGWLQQIATGQVPLINAPVLPGQEPETTGPVIVNYDEASAVDAFYNRVMKPETAIPVLPYRDWAPGDNPTGVAP